jgi:hypothetical protein
MARTSASALDRSFQLFGTRNRTAALVAIRLLGETYPAELAQLLGVRVYTIQQIVEAFEREAIIATRVAGRTRLVTLNPRYVAARELAALLWRLGQADVRLQQTLASRRRRPRRAGKPG